MIEKLEGSRMNYTSSEWKGREVTEGTKELQTKITVGNSADETVTVSNVQNGKSSDPREKII